MRAGAVKFVEQASDGRISALLAVPKRNFIHLDCRIGFAGKAISVESSCLVYVSQPVRIGSQKFERPLLQFGRFRSQKETAVGLS